MEVHTISECRTVVLCARRRAVGDKSGEASRDLWWFSVFMVEGRGPVCSELTAAGGALSAGLGG